MRILVISGQRGAGKSSLCRSIAENARARAIACYGCIETSLRGKNGVPYQIGLADLVSGQTYLAAERPRDRTDVPFQFYPHAFERIQASHEEFLHSAGKPAPTIALHHMPATQLALQSRRDEICIIDEIGPLELERHLGHAAFLKMVLAVRRCNVLVLTVRSSLQNTLLAQLNENVPERDILIIEIDKKSRQAAQKAALSYIGLA